MTDGTPAPRFKVGQIVVMKSVRMKVPFRILEITCRAGEWFYRFNRNNWAAEHMLRDQTAEEMGQPVKEKK